MLDYVSGPLARISPTEAVVDAAGLGYLLNISVNTYSAISELDEVKLLVHEIIREDAHELYGFFTEDERVLFRLLIGVSGVGPNTARIILSSLSPTQLQMCIIAADADKLKSIKGIGLKTAQRIIVDLKDKINAMASATPAASCQINATDAGNVSAETKSEALAALVILGYQKARAQKALEKVYAADSACSIENAIKRALAML